MLVDIQQINPSIVVELRYATENNFTGAVVYDFQTCSLVPEAAMALSAVQDDLQKLHLRLKVWDAYRPLSAQWKFWELVPDERYVSNPRKGGRHTRGTAVDVTLIDEEGSELPMPSLFDDFSEKAHRNYAGGTAEETQNRELLQKYMEKHGFIGIASEWWHFDYKDWKSFPVIGQ